MIQGWLEDALGLDISLARSRVLIGAAGAAAKLLEAEREGAGRSGAQRRSVTALVRWCGRRTIPFDAVLPHSARLDPRHSRPGGQIP